jgi:hypothetical protein
MPKTEKKRRPKGLEAWATEISFSEFWPVLFSWCNAQQVGGCQTDGKFIATAAITYPQSTKYIA